MKYPVLLLSLYLFSCNTSTQPASDPEPGLAKLLYKLEYDAIDAEFRLDTAAIAAIMDEDFISITWEWRPVLTLHFIKWRRK